MRSRSGKTQLTCGGVGLTAKDSYRALADGLRGCFREDQVGFDVAVLMAKMFRIDHYLGKEMVQNM